MELLSNHRHRFYISHLVLSAAKYEGIHISHVVENTLFKKTRY
jgi:hypothetical protein